MTKQQIINFAKAPFSKSFGIAYILALSNFLLIPLLSDLIYFISKNDEKLGKMEIDEVAEFFVHSFLPTLSMGDIVLAITGFFLSIILLGGYTQGLTYKTIIEKKDIFEVSKIQLSFSFIFLSTIKYFFASLTYLAIFVSFILISVGLPMLGIYVGHALNLSVFLSICIRIIAPIFFFILLYKAIFYLFTADLFFSSTLRISSFFHYRKVKSFFQANKSKIFITFLLAHVSGQMLNVLLDAIIFKIFEVCLIATTITFLFDLGCYWILALVGLLVFNFFWVYLSLLHGIVYGKIVLWLNGSIEEKTFN